MLPGLGDAVDLDRELDRNAGTVQFAGEKHDGRASPTVSEEHDVSLGLFFVAEDAVVIAIEQADDGFVGVPTMTVLEHLNEVVLGNAFANALGELNGLLVLVVVTHESANKTDENIRRGGWRAAGNGSVSSGGSDKERSGCDENGCDCSQGSESRQAGHAGSYVSR